MSAPTEERHPGSLSKRLLGEHGEIQLSALGQAISTVVSIAEILKKDGLALEKKLSTKLDSSTEDGRPKPKMEILLTKAPTFQAVVDQQAKEHEARQAAGSAPSNEEA